MLSQLVNSLNPHFEEVEFELDDSGINVTKNLIAHQWKSDYAHFYLAEVATDSGLDWKKLILEVDRMVLGNLQKSEFETGGVIDAHVCFVVEGGIKRGVADQLGERVFRNISRKYWVSKESAYESILLRLPILSISELPQIDLVSDMGLDKVDNEWLENIVKNPSKAAASFLKRIGVVQ